jgi:hypothetical protein
LLLQTTSHSRSVIICRVTIDQRARIKRKSLGENAGGFPI